MPVAVKKVGIIDMGHSAESVLIKNADFFAIYLQNIAFLQAGKNPANGFYRQSQIVAYICAGHRQAE